MSTHLFWAHLNLRAALPRPAEIATRFFADRAAQHKHALLDSIVRQARVASSRSDGPNTQTNPEWRRKQNKDKKPTRTTFIGRFLESPSVIRGVTVVLAPLILAVRCTDGYSGYSMPRKKHHRQSRKPPTNDAKRAHTIDKHLERPPVQAKSSQLKKKKRKKDGSKHRRPTRPISRETLLCLGSVLSAAARRLLGLQVRLLLLPGLPGRQVGGLHRDQRPWRPGSPAHKPHIRTPSTPSSRGGKRDQRGVMGGEVGLLEEEEDDEAQ